MARALTPMEYHVHVVDTVALADPQGAGDANDALPTDAALDALEKELLQCLGLLVGLLDAKGGMRND